MTERGTPRIRLTEWAKTVTDPPPAERTLLRWVAEGLIVPRPVKIGRAYFVEREATHVALARRRLVDRLKGGDDVTPARR